MKIPSLVSGEKSASLDCGLGHACQFCPDEGNCAFDESFHNKKLIEARLENIGQIVLVLANKGGVGKSTVSANLAAGLAQKGFRVGMADADIHGPNQTRFFGFVGQNIKNSSEGLQTHEFADDSIEHPVKLGSLGFMMEDDTTPIVWRDAYKHDFIHHLIGSFDWGSLDYLVVDMPPGTGNELITLCDLLEGSNTSAVLVSSPQAVAQMDSLKAARYCTERGLPVIGAVENMAGVVCPNCEHEFHLFPRAGLDEALAQMNIDVLTQLPLSAEIAMGSDEGKPVICTHHDSFVGQAFAPLIEAVMRHGRADFEAQVAATMGGVFQENLDDEAFQAALEQLPEGERDALGAQIAGLLDIENQRLQQSSRKEDKN